MKNADMPAMPVFDSSGCPSLYGDDGVEAKGLTKREMMAMHIIGGMAADPDVVAGADAVAKISVAWADAILAELESQQ